MPTENYRMVRLLLKAGKAKVVRRTPFTIQLLITVHTYTQPATVGVDTGIRHIGIVASNEKKVLYAAQTEQRTDISKNVKARHDLRRSRRSRNKRYRMARSLNRVRSKHKGWLAPCIEQLITVHLNEIGFVMSIVPIEKIRIETAEFDIHKIKDPTVAGVGYQFGEKFGFEQNTRNYVLLRDGHKCRYCGKTGGKLYVCSAEGRTTLAPEDLYTFCEKCFRDVCKGNIRMIKKRHFAPPTKMGIMRDTMLKRAKETFSVPVEKTTGAETKRIREEREIEKSHINDAFCIAGNLKAKLSEEYFFRKKVRCHNRQLRKANTLKGGIVKANQAPKEVFGFKLFDSVEYEGKTCFIFGRRASGYFDLRCLDGTKICSSASWKKTRLLAHSKTILTERRVQGNTETRRSNSSPTYANA